MGVVEVGTSTTPYRYVGAATDVIFYAAMSFLAMSRHITIFVIAVQSRFFNAFASRTRWPFVRWPTKPICFLDISCFPLF